MASGREITSFTYRYDREVDAVDKALLFDFCAKERG
jgi:hypothetical protein